MSKFIKSLVFSTALVSTVFTVVALILFAALLFVLRPESRLTPEVTLLVASLSACIALTVVVELQIYLVMTTLKKVSRLTEVLLESNVELTRKIDKLSAGKELLQSRAAIQNEICE